MACILSTVYEQRQLHTSYTLADLLRIVQIIFKIIVVQYVLAVFFICCSLQCTGIDTAIPVEVE